MKKILKNIWIFLKNNNIILMISLLMLTTLFIGYKRIYINNIVPQYRIHSLIEGTIDGEKTYFLITIDSSLSKEIDPHIILDSNLNSKSCIEEHNVIINNLKVYYPKKFKNLKPLVKEIKKKSGYEISGVIRNNIEIMDTIATK